MDEKGRRTSGALGHMGAQLGTARNLSFGWFTMNALSRHASSFLKLQKISWVGAGKINIYTYTQKVDSKLNWKNATFKTFRMLRQDLKMAQAPVVVVELANSKTLCASFNVLVTIKSKVDIPTD
jgi:hypothetical protein